MSPLEIQEKVTFNNKLIQDMLNPSQFVLNNKIRDLLKENENFQKQCPHHFVNGYCEFCFMEEPNKND